jgi:uncharacterized DUF497 family protein
MRFEWDERKNRRNRTKHRFSFELASRVFDDPHSLSWLDRIEDGEERWHTLGSIGGIAVLLVVHTFREESGDEVIRIISARKASPQERQVYEEGLRPI